MEKQTYQNIKLMNPLVYTGRMPVYTKLLSVQSMPIHMHDGLEMLWVLEGSLTVKISFHQYTLGKGDFLIVNPYEVHSVSGMSEENVILFLYADEEVFGPKEFLFVFDPDFYRNHNKNQVEKVKDLMAQLHFAPQLAEDLAVESLKILAEISRICCSHFLMHHFDPLSKVESPLIASKSKMDRVKNTYHHFYKGFEKPLRLSQIAEREYIDKFYAAHLIKEATGITFQENLNIVRIDRAEVFLLGTDMTINEVVETVGFSSSKYFNEQFKRYFHMTPGQYRKTYKDRAYPASEMQYTEISKQEEKKIYEQMKHKLSRDEARSTVLVLENTNMQEAAEVLLQMHEKKVRRIIIEYEDER